MYTYFAGEENTSQYKAQRDIYRTGNMQDSACGSVGYKAKKRDGEFQGKVAGYLPVHNFLPSLPIQILYF